MLNELREHFQDKCKIIDPDNWDNIYVSGDVHGCSNEFRSLINRIGLKDSELLICAGDVIRKGPDTAGAVNIVRKNENIISVKGNGEAKYIRGEKQLPCLDEDDREFIASWPFIIAWPGNAVVHGGFNPDQKVKDHSPKELVNMRSPKNNNNYETPFWFDEFDRSTRVFFGHTVTTNPIHQDNAIALDTGCVYGGKLTAYDTNNNEFTSVQAKKVYEPRDDSKYADRCRNKNPATKIN